MPRTRVRIMDLETGRDIYRRDDAAGFKLVDDGPIPRVHVLVGEWGAESIYMKPGWIAFLEQVERDAT